MSAPSHIVLMPVKPPVVGKSRLTDLPRRDLAMAFALDTATAVLRCESVAHLVVVTDDALLARGLDELGAWSIPDGVTGDLNATLRLAAAESRRRWPDLVPVALCADLPALRASDLALALGEAGPGRAFVPDAAGTGTTTYVASYDEFYPAFGMGSRQAHLDQGAREIGVDRPSLRRDVDEPDDLEAAALLGFGPHTQRWWATLR